jgi:uroporphyrinogen decarboxylase
MRPEQWQSVKAASKGKSAGPIPLALIVDSPWIPGYLGISHLDYYLQPDVWFESNLRIAREFPEAILFPSWWVEYGMAIEPSAVGARIHFHPDKTPDVSPGLFREDDIDRLPAVNPHADGLMPLALHLYGAQKQRIFDAGYTIPVVTARGPLCTAAFVRRVNEFMLDLAEHPEAAHRLIAYTTATVIAWLKAQAEAIGDSVEGIFVLDDIVGFLSRRMYQEFAHPYLKQICDAFPKDWVKVYHNDANVKPFLADLPDTGFDVLNFTHNLDIADAWEKTRGRMCLMGNVSPLEIGVRGSAEQTRTATLEVLRKMEGRGLILSLGGGMSPGMPGANIRAMIGAVHDFQMVA